MLRTILVKISQVIPLITLLSFGIMRLTFIILIPEDLPGVLSNLISAFIYTTVFSVVLIPAFYLLEHYKPVIDWKGIIIHVTVLTLLTLLSYAFATWLNGNLLGHKSMDDRTEVVSFLLTMMITIGVLIYFYVQLLVKRNKESRQQAIQAELAALRAQINPHFLFNSLNSIAALTRIDASQSEKVTEDLAELFRYSLNASKKGSVPLKEELESCDLYLNIEKARFGDRLMVTKIIDDETLAIQVPALIIQPLVENAVKHGLQRTSGNFEIKICAHLESNRLSIMIEDNGPGFNLTKPESYFENGTGLKNTRERIRYQFGGRGDLILKENGVEVVMIINPKTA